MKIKLKSGEANALVAVLDQLLWEKSLGNSDYIFKWAELEKTHKRLLSAGAKQE